MSGGAQAFDQSDNIRDRLYTELLHDTAALYLNCFFRGTELTSYLLVEHSLCYSYAHLSLSLCKGIEDGAVPAKLIATIPRVVVASPGYLARHGVPTTPEELVGRKVIVVVNLAPREFGKGLVSHGMLLATGPSEKLHLATVEGDVEL